MENIGRWLLITGLTLAVAGLLLWGLGRLGFRGLPGDVAYEGKHWRVYFPLVTSLALSALLTLALWLWQWLSRR